MILPYGDIQVVVTWKDKAILVDLLECKNCGRAIQSTEKYGVDPPGHYTHWGLNSTRCPDLDDGRDWHFLPKGEPVLAGGSRHAEVTRPV
jgi:hypothetical protein